MDIRNEIRYSNDVTPTWGTGSDETDWHKAATEAGNEILKIN